MKKVAILIVFLFFNKHRLQQHSKKQWKRRTRTTAKFIDPGQANWEENMSLDEGRKWRVNRRTKQNV